ncbi:MAG TPA: PAS domain-containing protein [Rhizomicrobium sp.]
MQALGLVWRDVDTSGADVQEKRVRIPEPIHFGSRLLFDTWRRRRSNDGFVVGRDVPSRPLASILRNLIVYEPQDGARDFRVRLAGSALIRRFDCDITGLKLSELFDRTSFECHRDAMVDIVQNDSTSVLDVKLVSRGRTQLHFEVVGLPVQSPDRSAVWVLGGLFYYDWTK